MYVRDGTPSRSLAGGSRANGAIRGRSNPAAQLRLFCFADAVFEGVQRKYGGIPDAVLHTPELLELLMPVLRADLSIVEVYRDRREAPLGCAISAFGGDR